eukprot:TRINITY_DN75925_c0_g1_i1.p1 TRINITY_DN75925_c0_g1~~TRINITY_DN75925_c0_g1_i1.p1  ORF type:complete len:301 (-),score=32.61 TRINITY_DN75925_c0_g1_i1:256-1041(-)
MMLMSLRKVTPFTAGCALAIDLLYEVVALWTLRQKLRDYKQLEDAATSSKDAMLQRCKMYYYFETEILRTTLGIFAIPVAYVFTEWAGRGWNNIFYVGYGAAAYGMNAANVDAPNPIFGVSAGLLLIHVLATGVRAYQTVSVCGPKILLLANQTVEKSYLYIGPITTSFFIFSVNTMWLHSGNDYTMRFEWIPPDQRSRVICVSVVVSLFVASIGPLALFARFWKYSQKVQPVPCAVSDPRKEGPAEAVVSDVCFDTVVPT